MKIPAFATTSVTTFVTSSVTLGFVLLCSGGALGQVGPAPIPQKHIPAPVLMELRTLESQFDLALSRDCAPERCISKGCAYRDHVVVDMPRATSLPGINQPEGPGSVPVQEYLTQVRCEFAHEKSVSARDVQALVRRLEQRLSKGWLQVTVGRQILDPISPALSQSPPPRPEPVPPPPAVVPPQPQPAPLARWQGDVALRELWLSLLPHFSWMIALVLATLATLLVIWGLRRLGRESLEEKAMAAQLSSGAFAKSEPDAAAASAPNGEDKERVERETREKAAAGFVGEQQRLWNDRVAQAELGKDDGLVVALVRHWLRAGEFDLLAKAILLFGDRLTLGFASDSELAVRKVEFAEHLRALDPQRLPSDAEFFRTLNQHAISSSLLSQSDAAIYRSLREELGTAGVTQLIERLPLRHGALLFALAPGDCQDQVARVLPRERRLQISSELLSSNRISREEREYLFAALDAARTGRPLPPVPAAAANAITDRGQEVGAAAALSILLTHVEPEDRQALFAQAFERSGGALPRWFEDILHPAMLLKLPPELRGDLLLEVDIRGLAAWCSMQDPAWQRTFVDSLAPSLQNALRSRGNNAFASRADQLRLARAGHHELVSALKRLLAQGRLSFWELVA
jgi:hypothetical protein